MAVRPTTRSIRPWRPLAAVLVTAILLALGGWQETRASTTNVFEQMDDGAWRTAQGQNWLAQSFTSPATAVEVTSVAVRFRNANETNSSAVPSNFSLSIWSASGGTPSAQLASVVSSNAVGPYSDEAPTFTLATPLALDPDTTYFVVMNGSAGGTVGWKCAATAPTTAASPTPPTIRLASTDGGSTWGSFSGACAGQYFSMRVVGQAVTPPTTTTTTTTTSTTTTSTTLPPTTTTTTTLPPTTTTTVPPPDPDVLPTTPPEETPPVDDPPADDPAPPDAPVAEATPEVGSQEPPPADTGDAGQTGDDGAQALFGDDEAGNVAMVISARPGVTVEGATVEVSAKALRPRTPLTVTVYSEPQVLLEASTDTTGAFETAAELPPLPPGRHTLVLEGRGPDGPVTVAGSFEVDADGNFGQIAQPAVLTSFTGPDDERLVRAVDAGLPVWDVAARPFTTAGIVVAATSLLALAGAGGLSGALGGTGAAATAMGAAGGQQRSSRGKLANMVTKKLKGISIESSARGDLSGLWARPGTAATDAWARTAPVKAGRWSAVLPRVLVDGAWLRALFGSFGFVLWLGGLGLAIASIASAPDTALTPALWFILAVVALSCLDAASGAIAWLTLVVWSAVTGQITSWPSVFTALGLAVLLLSVPLLAHVIRPLRRYVAGNASERWERVFDYVMMPVFVAFAAGAMAKALNGLAGLEVMNGGAVTAVRWTVGIAIVVRLAGEDIAQTLFPQRMLMVQPAKLVSPGRLVAGAAIVIRSAVFLLVAEPFFGFTPLTITAAVLLAVPQFMKLWEDDLPNSATLNKWLPRGLFRFLCLLVLGAFLTSLLLGDGSDDAIRSAFIWLLLPGVIVGVVELFARFGGDWPNVALRRSLGVVIWLAAVGIVTGLLAPFG